MNVEKRYEVGQHVYWNERDVVWSGHVVSCGDRYVAVWVRAGYMWFIPLDQVRTTP